MNRPAPRQRRGTILVLTAFLMVVLIAAAAMIVDIAYMHLVHTELQQTADAAARAASNALGAEQDLASARTAAITVAAANRVAGTPLTLTDQDIEFGYSERTSGGRFTFDPSGSPTNAVRVNASRTVGSNDGPVSLFLGPLLGRRHFQPSQRATSARVDRDICIVVDRSGSMAWDESGTSWRYPGEYRKRPWWKNYVTPPHPSGSRWAGLVGAVQMFREAVDLTEEVEYLGLVSYSNEYTYNGVSAETVTTEVEMTDNSAAIENAIISIGTEPIIGGTNISAGLDRGVEVVLDASTGRPFAFKVIILMTDGQWNAGRSPIAAAQDAANRNIVVHTITFSAGANQADMQQVADITGGKHYHAPTRTELEEAFREIAFSVPVVLIE